MNRRQVAEQAIITLINGAAFVDPDFGRHDLDCWYDQAAGLEQCSCTGQPDVAYRQPLAALLAATNDGPEAA